MGACLGRCFARVIDSSSYRFFQKHTRMSLEEEEPAEYFTVTITLLIFHLFVMLAGYSLLSFLSLKRFKKRRGIPVTLELLEDGGWSRGGNKYTRLSPKNDASTSSGLDVSLQVLDARTLMGQQAYISSTPGSSLDLEWEHEGLPLPFVNRQKDDSEGSITQTSVNNSQPSSLTASPWSRVSSPNSLEWDPVESNMVCIDMDTEQLLTEIERLTDRALKETGEWTSTDPS